MANEMRIHRCTYVFYVFAIRNYREWRCTWHYLALNNKIKIILWYTVCIQTFHYFRLLKYIILIDSTINRQFSQSSFLLPFKIKQITFIYIYMHFYIKFNLWNLVLDCVSCVLLINSFFTFSDKFSVKYYCCISGITTVKYWYL